VRDPSRLSLRLACASLKTTRGRVAIDHFVKMIERIVGAVVQIDHQHIGADFLQQFAAERGHTALVNDACAALVQRLAQLPAQLGVVEQQATAVAAGS
jgi:hypothetical protein